MTTPRSKGFIALVAVLIASALMLVAALAASRIGITATTEATGEESAMRARQLADACQEEALLRLRANLSYGGNESIIINGGDSCMIENIGGGGPTDRSIVTSAAVFGYTARVRTDIATMTPVLNIRAWTAYP